VNKVSGYKFLNYFFKHISKIKTNQYFVLIQIKKIQILIKNFLNKLGVKKYIAIFAPIL
jgi:hypothetical protein